MSIMMGSGLLVALGGPVIGGVLAAWLPRLRGRTDAAERRRVEEQLRASLREKDLLLRETHHRVKNNLQTIYSLLRLQSGLLRDPEAIQVFRESRERIRAIALLHDLLSRSQDLSSVAMEDYVRGVTTSLCQAYGVSPARVRLDLAVEPVALGLDRAIPCGLIINELVSNSLKHAFPDGRTGRIAVSLRAGHGDTYELTVADDGVGAPAPDDGGPASFGLELIRMLAHQLDGTLEQRGESGTCWRVVFRDSRGRALTEVHRGADPRRGG